MTADVDSPEHDAEHRGPVREDRAAKRGDMKLYVFPIAPNPTKVRLYLAEKAAAGAKIELAEVTVDLRQGEQKRAEHLSRNPFAIRGLHDTRPTTGHYGKTSLC